jgi:hypothetical protein
VEISGTHTRIISTHAINKFAHFGGAQRKNQPKITIFGAIFACEIDAQMQDLSLCPWSQKKKKANSCTYA